MVGLDEVGSLPFFPLIEMNCVQVIAIDAAAGGNFTLGG
jgi:hypothetical protein